jgi:hypothetical protein
MFLDRRVQSKQALDDGYKESVPIRTCLDSVVINLRQRFSAPCDGFDNDIGILHEHGNGRMLHRRSLHEAHSIHGIDDPFRQCRRQGSERAVYLRLGRHYCSLWSRNV